MVFHAFMNAYKCIIRPDSNKVDEEEHILFTAVAKDSMCIGKRGFVGYSV